MSNILRRLSNASQQDNSAVNQSVNVSNRNINSDINVDDKYSYSNYESNNKNVYSKPDKAESLITPDVKFEGEIEFKDSLKVFGNVSGNISSKGSLYLEKGSNINADIKAKNLTVHGNFKGKIEADGSVELLTSAKIYGNISASSIVVEEGVTFIGEARISKRTSN